MVFPKLGPGHSEYNKVMGFHIKLGLWINVEWELYEAYELTCFTGGSMNVCGLNFFYVVFVVDDIAWPVVMVMVRYFYFAIRSLKVYGWLIKFSFLNWISILALKNSNIIFELTWELKPDYSRKFNFLIWPLTIWFFVICCLM